MNFIASKLHLLDPPDPDDYDEDDDEEEEDEDDEDDEEDDDEDGGETWYVGRVRAPCTENHAIRLTSPNELPTLAAYF